MIELTLIIDTDTCYLENRIQEVLAQLTQRIESFEYQRQTITLSTSEQDSGYDTVNCQQSSAADQATLNDSNESNQDYLKSLSTTKVGIKINVELTIRCNDAWILWDRSILTHFSFEHAL